MKNSSLHTGALPVRPDMAVRQIATDYAACCGVLARSFKTLSPCIPLPGAEQHHCGKLDIALMLGKEAHRQLPVGWRIIVPPGKPVKSS
jgi:hypothetical protein